MALEGRRKFGKGNEPLTRRQFLTGIAAAAASAAAGVGAYEYSKRRGNHTEHKESIENPIDPQDISFLDNIQPAPVIRKMGPLKGRKLGGLLTGYTGIHGEVRAEEPFDPRERLAHLWKAKLNKSFDKKSGKYPEDLVAAARELFLSYNPTAPHITSLEQYRNGIGRSIEEVRSAMNLSKISSIPAFADFEASDVQLLEHLASLITAESMLAYSVTELMPTAGENAGIGLDLYDYLLRNGGSDFIDRIPALGDTLISVGPYQFTPYAIEENDHGGNGASVMQRHLMTSTQIGTSVVTLRGMEHAKAAYMFAVYNLAHAVQKLTTDQKTALKDDSEWIDAEDVVGFISAAHNRPSASVKAFQKYVVDRIKFTHPAHTKKKKKRLEPFLQHEIEQLSPELAGPYAKKTVENYAAIVARFKS